MIIAAAYVRVSTDEQTDYSPSAQLADIREYARQNGYHIPDEFVFTFVCIIFAPLKDLV